MPDWRLLAWIGDDPERVEAAQVLLDGDALRARGTSATADHTRSWALECGAGWATRRLRIDLQGDGWARSLDLRRDGRAWTAHRREGDAPPAEVDLTPLGLAGALDCDLALCPLTNTMPVLRHGLVQAAQQGEQRSVEFVMAWVDVPDLAIHHSPQTYSVLGPAGDGGALVRFVSEDFTADITVDRDGLVVDYPTISTRLVP